MAIYVDANVQVGCKCNAAMYWVNMPGMDEGNNPVPGFFHNQYFGDIEQIGFWSILMTGIFLKSKNKRHQAPEETTTAMLTLSIKTGKRTKLKDTSIQIIFRCPEYDTYEGNAETTNVALHTCDYVPPNDYPRSIITVLSSSPSSS